MIKNSYKNNSRKTKIKKINSKPYKNNSKKVKIKKNNILINNLIKKCLIEKNSKEEKIFRKINRSDFCLDNTNLDVCFFDKPDKLLSKQTISAPHMHAHAVKNLKHKLISGAKVLDIGCGSGILTTIFSYLVDILNNENSLVVGVDIYDNIIDNCINNISKNHKEILRSNRLKIFKADAWKGVKLSNKLYKNYFDVIHVGAKADSIPEILYQQLAPGGRMFIPIEKDGKTNIFIIDKPMKYKKLGLLNLKKDLRVNYVPLQKT